MRSPFPGMDPYIESQEWEDFHTTFNTVVREQLVPKLGDDYLIRVERRVYLEQPGEEPHTMRRPDIAIVAVEAGLARGIQSSPTDAAVVDCTLPMPIERRETYLVIRERQSMEVVTVIECLSPANKRRGGDGRREYLAKRSEFLESSSHLVEIDLLRGGERLPVVEGLPPGDYFAIVSRANRRPRCSVYAWSVQQPLPTLPIPLKHGDADAALVLQEVFNTVYERARYDLSIDYRRPMEPPLGPELDDWAGKLVGT